jgi:hypothetical protein
VAHQRASRPARRRPRPPRRRAWRATSPADVEASATWRARSSTVRAARTTWRSPPWSS